MQSICKILKDGILTVMFMDTLSPFICFMKGINGGVVEIGVGK